MEQIRSIANSDAIRTSPLLRCRNVLPNVDSRACSVYRRLGLVSVPLEKSQQSDNPIDLHSLNLWYLMCLLRSDSRPVNLITGVIDAFRSGVVV